jgi:hypothetical protein
LLVAIPRGPCNQAPDTEVSEENEGFGTEDDDPGEDSNQENEFNPSYLHAL